MTDDAGSNHGVATQGSNLRLALKLLNFIARITPALAKRIEAITASLLAWIDDPETIAQRRLAASDTPVRPTDRRDASSSIAEARHHTEPGGLSTPPESVPGLPRSSASAADDIVLPNNPRRVEQDQAVASEKSEPAPEKPVSDHHPNRTHELALKQIEDDFITSRKRMDIELSALDASTKTIFILRVAGAILSLAFIVIGAYLLFFRGVLVLGTLAELLGLIAGTGSAILKGLETELSKKRRRVEEKQDRQTHYLQAIQVALALSGPEREAQLSETAKWLRERRPEASLR